MLDFGSLLINWFESLPYIEYFKNPYVLSLLIFLASLIFAKIVLFAFNKYLEKFAHKTQSNIDDLIFTKTKIPLFWLIVVYGFGLALLNLGIDGMIIRIINSLMACGFLLILMRILEVILEHWGESFAKKTTTNIDEVLLPIFKKSAKVVFVIIAILWILAIWGVDITPYLAGAGLAGLVLGLAVQDSLKNVFGGISLLLDKTIQVNDKIKLESGETGIVKDIGLRSTKIVTFDNRMLHVPNGYLANSRVQNYLQPDPKERVSIDFGVEYGTDPEKVRKVVFGVIDKMKDILDDPKSSVDFLEMADFALKFRVYFWVPDWNIAYNKKIEATDKIYQALNKAKIKIPFPTQTVYLKK